MTRRFRHKGFGFEGSKVDVSQKFRRSVPSPQSVAADYRDVVLTRDWYESLVSGT